MSPCHSPKPNVFGKGYGKHLANNFGLIKIMIKLIIKLFINVFVPGVYYEEAHWRVIDLYYKMNGYRHGTNNPKRCEHCGSKLEPKESLAPVTIQAPIEPEIVIDEIAEQCIGEIENGKPLGLKSLDHK